MKLPESWNSYLFEYDHDGSSWSFEIPARNEQEARERVNELSNARYLGEIKMTVNLPKQTHLFVRLISRTRTIFGFT
ncbi:MAG TPA: hypothetical protein VN956_26920 [Pyrinomonadaceae bacterium]|nr:hypothetical protein [Pyrinomonadaceae bacterium]